MVDSELEKKQQVSVSQPSGWVKAGPRASTQLRAVQWRIRRFWAVPSGWAFDRA